MNVITKKSPTTTTAATSGTSYLSMMTSNVASTNNNNNIKRRESSMGEDSGVQIDHDSTGKIHTSSKPNLAPSLSASSISKSTGTTTAPNPRTGSVSTTMVTSSTLIPPTVDAKSSPSSSPPASSSSQTLVARKDSNASSSGAFSEPSRSFGHEETSSDSLFSHTSPSSSSHYVVKCNVNPTNSAPTPSVTLTPRVKVTVQQPSIRSSRFDSSSENLSSTAVHLKTPTSIMTTSTASSAPEFSLSGPSSVDDSDELALYDQCVSSRGRQSNPSPELRKKTFDDWIKIEQRSLPRSKSEINTLPSNQSQSQITSSQLKKVCYSLRHSLKM
jgi:hypothetical protein